MMSIINNLFSAVITIAMYFLLFLATFFVLPILFLFETKESENSL